MPEVKIYSFINYLIVYCQNDKGTTIVSNAKSGQQCLDVQFLAQGLVVLTLQIF